MGKSSPTFLDRFARNRLAARWARLGALAPELDPEEASAAAAEALAARAEIDAALRGLEGRICRPVGGDGIVRPLGCDWAWRPEVWTAPLRPQGLIAPDSRARLGTELTLFHDCARPDLSLRQSRTPAGPAPFGLVLEVFRFDGSFLSLVLDLPEVGARGMRLDHLLRLDMRLTLERPIEVFCRLNIQHGPNTEQLVRELPLYKAESHVDFDLGYTRLNEKRIEKAWIDLIFEGPQMNRIAIADLTLARHPRAEI